MTTREQDTQDTLCHYTSCLRIGNVKSVAYIRLHSAHQQFEVCPRRPPKQVRSRWPCGCRQVATLIRWINDKETAPCLLQLQKRVVGGILHFVHLWAWPWADNLDIQAYERNLKIRKMYVHSVSRLSHVSTLQTHRDQTHFIFILNHYFND